MAETLKERFCLAFFVVHFVLWIPLITFGVLLGIFRSVFVSRWMGVSGTAVTVLNGRWILSAFGMREDDSARKLAQVVPNNSPFGLRLVFAPFYMYYLLTGASIYPEFAAPGQEEFKHTIANRSLYFDKILSRHIPVHQFVLLGAGFDTRFYGMSELAGKKLFELDKAKTQQLKRENLVKAGIPTEHVVYVEADFTSSPESDCGWPEQLRRSGFDPTIPTAFIWEGVSLYITREDVVATVKSISDMAAPGSVLVADIYGTKFEAKHDAKYKSFLRLLKEEIKFLLDFKNDARGEIKKFFGEQGLLLGDTYILGNKNKEGAWMAVVEVLL